MRRYGAAMLVIGCLALASGTPADLSKVRAEDARQVDLKTQLEKGLKARRAVEFEFIETVVNLVNAGTLPQPIVDSTFGWARKKPEHQFQYFEAALRIRAKKIGVNL